MRIKKLIVITCLLTLVSYNKLTSQTVDDAQLGAWFMYYYNAKFSNSNWGIQGDFQYRDWRGLGDKEQLLLRSGITFTPKNSGIMFTVGISNITTGAYGVNFDNTFNENRLYQEALFSNTVLKRVIFTHRFRFEQRWVENQDFRTRYRYNIFMNIPFNNASLIKNTYYFAFYNELFMNGQTDIGSGRTVEFFDRNRMYVGFGYALQNNIRFQLGWMEQTTNNWQKGQLQFSVHHTIN